MKYLLLGSGLLAAALASVPAHATTLDDVKAKGYLQCGVSAGVPGFSAPDNAGKWSGIDVDVCRAVAAAIFGDDTKVRYSPLDSKERFTALQSGEIDLLSRNSTWSYKVDASLGLDFEGVNYYDGQGFLVRKDLNVTDPKGLDGATICVRTGTTTELNLADYFRKNNIKFTPVVYGTSDELRSAYEAGRCDALTGDRSNLATQKMLMKKPDENVLLAAVISKEPLGPVVRQGDSQWGDIVRWSLDVMILGEEHGVSSKNAKEMRDTSQDPTIRRLLGVEGDMGPYLGLPKEWSYDILSKVGNYKESFDRNVGKDSPLGLERGINALWTEGGIMYAPPLR